MLGKYMLPVLLASSWVFIAGCSTSSELEAASAEKSGEETEIVCRRERKLGSNFKETVCKTRRELQAETDAAQREMERNRNTQQRTTIKGPVGN